MENQKKATEKQTEKPQTGTWNNLQGYPKKITFELEKPVHITFAADFESPVEMPNTNGEGVYYIFNVLDGNGEKASIATSAWTLLNSLKTHEPLAGKSLILTKKNVKGKNMYYVQKPDTYNAPKVEKIDKEETIDTEATPEKQETAETQEAPELPDY